MSTSAASVTVASNIPGVALASVPLHETQEGRRSFRFHAAPGLLQLNLFFDAANFDWEGTYQVLNAYGNTNKRTGPWDFDLFTAGPLVPSYWVFLDGKKLGLWYAQRVMIEDVEDKRFRGRLAFEVTAHGEHELVFEPYRKIDVKWLSALLESDPDDTLVPVAAIAPPTSLPAAKWNEPGFWDKQKAKLETTHAAYKPALKKVFDWAMSSTQMHTHLISALIAAHGFEGRPGAIEKAIAIVNHFVALPAWGRPREDVYGHNGDIGAGDAILNMAWAYHMLKPHMNAEDQKKLLDKLEYQGNAFLTQTLLMRDYWGGSVIQDHGRKAVFDFGTAALHLWGIVPSADRWVSYIIPRCQRGLDAAPPEGVIPPSSYFAIFAYAHHATWYRDALLARTGHDILDEPSLRNLPGYVAKILHEPTRSMQVVAREPLIGGQAIMAYVAAKFQDREAARVHNLLLDLLDMDFYHGSGTVGYYMGPLWGFFAFDPAHTPEPAPAPPATRTQMQWFEDAGFAQFRNDKAGAVLSVFCGPWLGYHAQRKAPGPCDRMECTIGAGHFVLFLDGDPILCTPDTGYRMRTALRSVMLVDGKGQIGDVGYPMSIPSMPHRGEEIEHARWDTASGTGLIRLNLTRAYARELGVSHYTRQFLVGNDRKIICRDHVVLVEPRKLSWLFQHKESAGHEMNGLACTIGKRVTISPASPSTQVTASIERTDVVFSYASASGFKPFDHLKYDTTEATRAACIDFTLAW